jgi:hypothetical protein
MSLVANKFEALVAQNWTSEARIQGMRGVRLDLGSELPARFASRVFFGRDARPSVAAFRVVSSLFGAFGM